MKSILITEASAALIEEVKKELEIPDPESTTAIFKEENDSTGRNE